MINLNLNIEWENIYEASQRCLWHVYMYLSQAFSCTVFVSSYSWILNDKQKIEKNSIHPYLVY